MAENISRLHCFQASKRTASGISPGAFRAICGGVTFQGASRIPCEREPVLWRLPEPAGPHSSWTSIGFEHVTPDAAGAVGPVAGLEAPVDGRGELRVLDRWAVGRARHVSASVRRPARRASGRRAGCLCASRLRRTSCRFPREERRGLSSDVTLRPELGTSFFRAASPASSARCWPWPGKAEFAAAAASRIQRRKTLSAGSRSWLACGTDTLRSVTGFTASILNPRLNVRPAMSALKIRGDDPIFASTEPAAGHHAFDGS